MEVAMAKKGLWYYMHKRRKAGKPKKKPGEKGYPGPGAFDRAILDLRQRRNTLLSSTDFYALSDVTMSPEMETYRQELRDITNGLTTVEDVEAVVFPNKP